MSTPHINANKGDIAKVVLMPGDPLRAKFIAETFLENIEQFNTVRNMFGYTGTYKGVRISVMGSGMGMPSIGIYSYELYSQFDVETIIRIGSAGGYTEDMKVYDTILASHAYSESSYAYVQCKNEDKILKPSTELNETLIASANKLDINLKIAGVHSSDVFYRQGGLDYTKAIINDYNCKVVEMESFALFSNANVLGKKAACLLTVSDSFVTNEITTAKERETSFTNMMKIALEACI